MITNQEIISSIESTITTLEKALQEREKEFRSLLYAEQVSSIEDLEDVKLYAVGSEITSQIDTIKDLLNDIKYQLKYIFTFKSL